MSELIATKMRISVKLAEISVYYGLLTEFIFTASYKSIL